MNQTELFNKINTGLKYYEIGLADAAVNEINSYVEGDGVGYKLTNKLTGVVENTSTMLYALYWQAQHAEGTLSALLKAADEGDVEPIAVDGDVVPTLN